MLYGLQYTQDGETVSLLQISGGGRIRLGDGRRQWWARAPHKADWRIVETDHGQTYRTRAEASEVAARIGG